MQPSARNPLRSSFFPLPAAADEFESLKQAGLAALSRGDFDLAIAGLSRAEALEPDAVEILFPLAVAWHASGRLEQAVAVYFRLLSIEPESFDALHNLGLAYSSLEQAAGAADCFERALRIAPDHVEARYNLGVVLQQTGRLDQAACEYQHLLKLQPDHSRAHLNLGVLYDSQGRLDAAVNSYRKALQIEPGNAAAHLNLGMALEAQGDMAGALASFGQAMALDPELVEAQLYYADCKKIGPEDAPLVESIGKFLLRSDLEPALVSHIRFSLGKCHNDLGEYPTAFAHYRAGHLIERAGRPFDSGRHALAVDELIKEFDSDFFLRRSQFGNPSEAPIFIVGMPRSGTTLFEQIISSHPQVCGAGELDFWSRRSEWLVPERALRISEGEARVIADDYVALLDSVAAGASRVIDKMPQNFFMLGLIRLCLPNARIIHVRRNPLDTCVSIYSQKFAVDHPYAHDLDDLADYYEQYRRLMRHWQATLPGRFFEVDYEDLVNDQEAVTRRLLDFCGLEWDARCLDFQRNQRKVATASSWQVRQRMYTGSIGRWRNYEQFVAPLLRLLNP